MFMQEIEVLHGSGSGFYRLSHMVISCIMHHASYIIPVSQGDCFITLHLLSISTLME